MATYVLLTRLSNEAIGNAGSFTQLTEKMHEKFLAECPEVKFVANYSVLGPYDYLDIFQAPDNVSAAKVAVVVRSFGLGTTEIWPASSQERFREIVEQTAESEEPGKILRIAGKKNSGYQD